VTASRLFVRWDPDVQAAFCELARRDGVAAAARRLEMNERAFHHYRNGLSRNGVRGGRVVPRKFVSVAVLNRLADALDEPLLTSREALSQQEWSDRGEWAYFSVGAGT
jgi:hypothetical protein